MKLFFESIWGWLKSQVAYIAAGAVCVAGFLEFVKEAVGLAVERLIILLPRLVVDPTLARQHAILLGEFTHWLQVANTFFPLAEMFSLASALVSLWAACVTYRLVKSWIPTVS